MYQCSKIQPPLVVMEKRVAIVGAGVSGLLAYKYVLRKGFEPIVFEADERIGGVWGHTMESTKLQNTKQDYHFSDFPWPSLVKQLYPSHIKVLQYLESYARHFGIYPCIKFSSNVTSVDQVEGSHEEIESWHLWGGKGMPLSSKGKWHITVKRWGISKVVECYLRWKFPLKKYEMIPKHSFHQDVSACRIALLPENFYSKMEEGSIIIKNSPSFSFCREGLIIDGETKPLKTAIVIYATGVKGDEKLKNIFAFPIFQQYIMGSSTSILTLYRQVIHPRIPQLAVIGYTESVSNLSASEIRCQWLAHFLDGNIELPSIKEMEKEVKTWEKYVNQISGKHFRRSCIGEVHVNDQLCKDMGRNQRLEERRENW